MLATVIDISARKTAEEEARHRREQVDRLGRVSLLGEMTASLAHELQSAALRDYEQRQRGDAIHCQ